MGDEDLNHLDWLAKRIQLQAIELYRLGKRHEADRLVLAGDALARVLDGAMRRAA